jgi:hypothetical protein
MSPSQQIGNLAQLENHTICDKTLGNFFRLKVIDSSLMASGNSSLSCKGRILCKREGVFPSCATATWFFVSFVHVFFSTTSFSQDRMWVLKLSKSTILSRTVLRSTEETQYHTISMGTSALATKTMHFHSYRFPCHTPAETTPPTKVIAAFLQPLLQ